MFVNCHRSTLSTASSSTFHFRDMDILGRIAVSPYAQILYYYTTKIALVFQADLLQSDVVALHVHRGVCWEWYGDCASFRAKRFW